MTKNINPGIGVRIRDRRKELKLTQESLAKRLGVEKAAVSHWEKGRSLPVGSRWAQLAKELRTNSHYLLSGIETAPTNQEQSFEHMGVALLPEGDVLSVLNIAKGKATLSEIVTRKPAIIGINQSADDKMLWPVADNATKFTVGSQMMFDLTAKPLPGDYVLCVLLASDEVLVRRYRPGAASKPGEPPFTLVPDNERDYEPRVVTRQDRPKLLGPAIKVSYDLR
jgi:transcriptional regulator with XRE-family HTH domain